MPDVASVLAALNESYLSSSISVFNIYSFNIGSVMLFADQHA